MKTILIVLDSVGVGALPDAREYDPEPGNTLGNIAGAVGGLTMPFMEGLGLGKVTEVKGLRQNLPALGAYGKMASRTKGKDTTAGHWEIAGLLLDRPLPTFPQGFPDDFILDYQEAIGRLTLGNVVASGTEIIQRLGAAHMETGYPIVYTSADSVFQLAAHEEVIPLHQLYQFCETARRMLTDDLGVGRVIARPFVGAPGNFSRTANRHDYSLRPIGPTILEGLAAAGKQVLAVGKIKDIYAGYGITGHRPTTSNAEGIAVTLEMLDQLEDGLIFTNLVDFDMLYGHRNNPQGYAEALEEADRLLAPLAKRCEAEGILLMITADHGNDPTTADTDHNREYVPVLACGGGIKKGVDLGIRETFADIAATLAERHQIPWTGPGKSFYPLIKDQS